MNRLFLTTLLSAIIATSAFAESITYDELIKSNIDVKNGSTFEIRHKNYGLSKGTQIRLAPGIPGNEGKLIIDNGKFLKSEGGRIEPTDSSGNAKVILDGTLVVLKDETIRYPLLEEVEIDSNNTGETYGLLDLSEIKRDEHHPDDLIASAVKISAPAEGKNAPKVKLPFNCKFRNVDLTNASHVEYKFVNSRKVVAR